jgi:transposase
MARQRSTRERIAILRWYERNGRSVTKTCERFGISRATLARWKARYDPEAPAKSLKPRSRRPDSIRVPQWTDRHLALIADLSLRFPAYGQRRLHAVLSQDGFPFSESTVGRLLAIVRKRCPICGERGGGHEVAGHVLWRGVGQLDPEWSWIALKGSRTKLARVRRQQHRKRRQRAKKGRA